MKIKTIAKFVGMKNNGEYDEIKQTYLIPADNFCDAEKTTITLIKENEDPKENTTEVIALTKYIVDLVIYKEQQNIEIYETSKNPKFFEVITQASVLVSNGKIKKIKTKMIIEADDIENARVIALDQNINSSNMFDESKIIAIKETDIYKSLI